MPASSGDVESIGPAARDCDVTTHLIRRQRIEYVGS
jgi:hypothetical protein